MTAQLTVRLRKRVLNSPAGDPLRRVRRTFRPAMDQDAIDNAHLRAIMAAVLEPDSNCIDIGAHQGAVLADMVRLSPFGRHFAFEPLPNFARELARRFPTAEVRELALSDHEGESSFVHVVTFPGFSGLREHKLPRKEELEHLTVKTARLDDVLPPDYAPRFIKIDVEGAEFEVLRGAIATIERHRPIIAFEHGLGGADYYGTSPDQIFSLLVDDAGLRLFDISGGGPYDRDLFRTNFAQHEQVNFLARPYGGDSARLSG